MEVAGVWGVRDACLLCPSAKQGKLHLSVCKARKACRETLSTDDLKAESRVYDADSAALFHAIILLTVWGVVLCCAVQGPIPEGLGELGLRVALSVGELDKEAYQTLYDAGMEGWHCTGAANAVSLDQYIVVQWGHAE